ncbi:MAG: hypothetical protein ACOC1N_03895 [Bacillota bacterium]
MRKFVFFLLIFFVVCSVETADAYDLTARSFGMGGAFTAVADNIEALLYNPAGNADSGLVGFDVNGGLTVSDLSKLNKILELEGKIMNDDVDDLLSEIPDELILEGQALVGARLKRVSLAYNAEISSHTNFNGNDSANVYLNNYNEYILSYGKELINPPLDLGTFSYGFNVKLINMDRQNYFVEDNNGITITEQKIDGNSFGIDFGLLAKVTETLRVGCHFENVFAPDAFLNGTEKTHEYNTQSWEETSTREYQEIVPIDFNSRVGAALYIPVVDLTAAMDIDHLFSDGDQVLHYGLEKNLFFDGLSLRAGKMSSSNFDFTTFGFGLNLTGFNLDAAFGSRSDIADDMSVALSASMNF